MNKESTAQDILQPPGTITLPGRRKPPGIHLISLVERIYAPERYHWGLRLLIIALLLVISTALVYFTGGTYLAFPHAFYIPIILANFLMSPRAGIITAIVSGIMIGFIPLNVSSDTPQEPVMILSRTVFFLLVSAVAGISAALSRGYIDFLRIKVSEKTKELESNYKKLKELQEFKEFLSSTIVHDLKTSLSSVMLSVSTLKKLYGKTIDDNGRSLLDTSISAGHRMLTMIGNILDVYAQEEGKFSVTLSEWDPYAAIQQIVEEFSAQAAIRKISLTYLETTPLPCIQCDGDLMRRTLENLIANALAHTPSEGAITISTTLEEKTLTVSVTNTGSYIPPEWREKIFDKFARVDDSENKKAGSGLGLAFCRIAAEAHGGKIWNESSSEGARSTAFFFTIPLSPVTSQ
ncbi:MAG: sensor histidine kinase [Vulcanimicrobiota bacterium]